MIGNASKLLRYPDRLADFWLGRPVIPIALELHPTNRCNQRCSYCPIKHSPTDLLNLAGVVDQARDLGIRGITLTGGGEPMLANIASATGRGLPVGLITNGSVEVSDPRPGTHRRMIFGLFSWVRFSVDACDPKAYKAIRGVDMPDCLEDNIRMASRATTTGVQMVITKDNVNHVQDMAAWAKELGADYLYVRPNESGELIWPNDAMLAGVPGIRMIVRRDKLTTPQPAKCVQGHFTMTVTADGRCWACSCLGPRYCVGDLKSSTLEEVVYSKQREKVMAGLKTEGCPPMCRGLAVNAAIAESGEHCQWL